jgi:hypothetical protein
MLFSVKLKVFSSITSLIKLFHSVNALATGPIKLNLTDLAAIEIYDAYLVDSYLKSPLMYD